MRDFRTYAWWYVKKTVNEAIVKGTKISCQPEKVQRICKSLKREIEFLYQLKGKNPTEDEIVGRVAQLLPKEKEQTIRQAYRSYVVDYIPPVGPKPLVDEPEYFIDTDSDQEEDLTTVKNYGDSKKQTGNLDEFGCVEPLVWNKRTGNLVEGHQRFKIILAQGAKEAQVSVVDLPIEKEKALNIAFNKIRGDWDKNKLAELIDELVKTPQIDIETVGFDMPEAEQLISDIHGNTEPVEATDLQAQLNAGLPVITRPGDLIELGLNKEHRILCGDVTKPADVAKLMGDNRARLCHTDPPYNVNYDRNNRPSSTKTKKSSHTTERIRNDDLTPKRYEAWFSKVVNAFAEAMVSGAPFYIWNSHKNFGLMHDLLTRHKFKVASVITWAKESFSPGFGDYNEQVEYCLYGWRKVALPVSCGTGWKG